MPNEPTRVYIVESFPTYGSDLDARCVLYGSLSKPDAIAIAVRIAAESKRKGNDNGEIVVTEIPLNRDNSNPNDTLTALKNYSIEQIIWSVAL